MQQVVRTDEQVGRRWVRRRDRQIRGTGDLARTPTVGDAVRKVLVLTGDPRLYDRGDVLAGEKIDMALDSKEVRVEKAKGRLHPEKHQEEEARP